MKKQKQPKTREINAHAAKKKCGKVATYRKKPNDEVWERLLKN